MGPRERLVSEERLGTRDREAHRDSRAPLGRMVSQGIKDFLGPSECQAHRATRGPKVNREILGQLVKPAFQVRHLFLSPTPTPAPQCVMMYGFTHRAAWNTRAERSPWIPGGSGPTWEHRHEWPPGDGGYPWHSGDGRTPGTTVWR